MKGAKAASAEKERSQAWLIMANGDVSNENVSEGRK
jgi:hypothetical protein